MSRHAGESAETTGMVRHHRLVTPVGGVLKFPHTAKIAAGVVLATGSVLGVAALTTTSAEVPEPADGVAGSRTGPTQTDSAAVPPPAWPVQENLLGLDLRLDDPPAFAPPPTLTQQAVQISLLGPITPGVTITIPGVGEIAGPGRVAGPEAAPSAASGHLVVLAPVTGARGIAASFDNGGTAADAGAGGTTAGVAFAAQGAALRSPARQDSSPIAPPPPLRRPVLLAGGPVQLAPVVRRPAPPAAEAPSGSVDARVAPDVTPLIATSTEGGERARQRPSDPAMAVLLATPIDTPPADAVPADGTPPADTPVAATDVGVTNRTDVIEQAGPPTDATVRPTPEVTLGDGAVASRMVADSVPSSVADGSVEGSAVIDIAVTDAAAENIATTDIAATDTAVTDTAATDIAVTDIAFTDIAVAAGPTTDSTTGDGPSTTGAADGGATVDDTIASVTPEAQPAVAELADRWGDTLGPTAPDA